jgi:predicted O-methyltransferase YrrM
MKEKMNFGIDNDSFPYIFYKNIRFYGLNINLNETNMHHEKNKLEIIDESFKQIIKDIRYRFEYNREVVPHMHCNILKNDKVMEVGAYLGYYSMHFANVVGENGHVYSLEFDKNAYITMLKNFYTIFHITLQQ